MPAPMVEVDERRCGAEVVAAGTVGKLDARTKSSHVRRYENDADALEASSILGVKRTRSAAEIRAARLNALRNAKPGVPVTWKKYPLAKINVARVAVADIKKQKIMMLRPLGQLDAWLESNADYVLVMIARPSADRGATFSATAAEKMKMSVRRGVGTKASAT